MCSAFRKLTAFEQGSEMSCHTYLTQFIYQVQVFEHSGGDMFFESCVERVL